MKHNWTYKKLGDVCKVNSGKGIAAELISPNYSPSLFPCYGGNGIRGYVKTPSHNGVHPIIGRVGALCGNVHLAKGEFYATEHALIVTITDNGVNPEWLSFLLKYKDLSKIAKGVAQPVISASEVMKQELPMPSLDEQQAIVRELDGINRLIELQEEQLREYDRLAQSLFYTTFGDPVSNPKGWVVKKLGEICDVRDGTHDSPQYLQQSEYLLITSKNIVDGKIDFASSTNYISKEDYEAINKRSKVDVGDIIMPMIGTIGNPIIIGETKQKYCIKNVALIKFTNISDVVNIYVKMLLDTPSYMEYIHSLNKGGTQKFIALGTIRQLSLPLPPLALQQTFAAQIEAIEQQKALIRRSLDETRTLLAARMQYYFE